MIHGGSRTSSNQDPGRGRPADPDGRSGCRIRHVAPVARLTTPSPAVLRADRRAARQANGQRIHASFVGVDGRPLRAAGVSRGQRSRARGRPRLRALSTSRRAGWRRSARMWSRGRAVVSRELELGGRLVERGHGIVPEDELGRLSRNRNVLAALLGLHAALFLEHGQADRGSDRGSVRRPHRIRPATASSTTRPSCRNSWLRSVGRSATPCWRSKGRRMTASSRRPP